MLNKGNQLDYHSIEEYAIDYSIEKENIDEEMASIGLVGLLSQCDDLSRMFRWDEFLRKERSPFDTDSHLLLYLERIKDPI